MDNLMNMFYFISLLLNVFNNVFEEKYYRSDFFLNY